MNSREKKFLFGGVAGGVLLAAIMMGAYAVQGSHKMSPPPQAAAPEAAPAATHSGHGAASAEPEIGGTVQLTPDEINAAGVQTAQVRAARLRTDIDAFGRVEQPEAQLASLSARVAGRIDKLHVQYTGQEVRRGQAVAEIYSPEAASAAEEYRLAMDTRDRLRSSSDADARESAEAMVDASRRRLQLWGISDRQVRTAASGESTPHLTIYATVSGTVVERKVTQGQYVNAGDTLFLLADLSTVWVKADVYESQMALVRAGQPVEIRSEALPGRTIRGNVEFIEPSANLQTRTVSVHVHVPNPGMRLRPGMFVNTKFLSRADRATLIVPRSAVLDTGTRKVVYIAKPGGAFEAREVAVGSATEDAYPVLSGLRAGEQVVTNGNFLIDSQTRLTGGMTGLFGGSREFTAHNHNNAGAAPASVAARITFASSPDPPKGGKDNVFHVTLADAQGTPIPDAKITVTFVMPAMPSMNMPEMRSAFELPWVADRKMYMGPGNVPMAGPWNVTVEAAKDGRVIASHRTRVSAN